jgi:CRP/FNR family transcriptional regulator, cyclic AMP receptor protein
VPEKNLARSKAGLETNAEKAAFLAKSELFRKISEQDREELERYVSQLICVPGRILYRPGEAGSGLFFVRAGRVQLYHLSADGRKLITATLTAGEWFGELPLLNEGQHQSFAEVVEESTLYLIPKQEIEQMLGERPRLALGLLQIVGKRFVQLEEQLLDAAFKSTGARLAALLLELAGGEDKREVVGMSHEELAEHLGVYRETVSAALRELKEKGVVVLGRKKIVLKAPERLAEIAGEKQEGAGN